MSDLLKFTEVAGSVPFDPTGSITSDNVQDAIVEIASRSGPILTWGRSGTVPPSTWLLNDTIVSNKTGREVGLSGCKVTRVNVSKFDATIIKLGIYYHLGNSIGLTQLGTVTTAAQRSDDFGVNFPVPQGTQLAVRIESDSPNSATEPTVGLSLLGAV
jgi:hypothetical protein